MGRVLSVNVGRVQTVEHHGRLIKTAIAKKPVDGEVEFRGSSVGDDEQADRKAHGGPNKAVYVYAAEDYRWWQAQLDRELGSGTFGENVTTDAIDVSGALIGERWRMGQALLEVSEPRIPCYKLGLRMADPEFPRRFGLAVRPGAYLRIIEPGAVAVGSPVEVVSRPEDGVSVADVAYIFNRDRGSAHRLLAVEDLSQAWIDWAEQVVKLRRRHGLTTEPPPSE